MVRIRRRGPGGGGGPAAPWPDGRDPLPPVVDVEAFGPVRAPLRLVRTVRPVSAAAVAPEAEVEVDEPDLELDEPELEPGPEPEPEPEPDPWLDLPEDLWDRPPDEPLETVPYVPPAIDPEPLERTRPLVAFAPVGRSDPADAGDPGDPVVPPGRAAAAAGPPRRVVDLASAALVMACVVLLTGILTASTGLAGDDENEVATGQSTTTTAAADTTSTSGFSATLPVETIPTTGTTSVPSSGEPAPSTSSPRITLPPRGGGGGGGSPTTTAPPSPDPTSSTSTTLPPNRPMTTELRWTPEPAVAGEPVDFTVEWTDQDAVPSTRCIEITGDDGISIQPIDDDCDAECPEDPSIPLQGGVTNHYFTHTFSAAGTYEITVRNRSGDPWCGNRYSSVDDETFTVEVDPAN